MRQNFSLKKEKFWTDAWLLSHKVCPISLGARRNKDGRKVIGDRSRLEGSPLLFLENFTTLRLNVLHERLNVPVSG